MFIESLEDRSLFAAAFPTALEQYFIEVINRARANPTAEAKSFRIALNEGLPPNTILPTPKQPLAVNPFLVSAARKYSTALLNPPKGANPQPGVLNHFLNGTNPGGGAQAEGYPSANALDNLVWVSHSGSTPTLDNVLRSHELLFKDFTATFEVVGRGHRTQQLKPTWNEIGMGISVGPFGSRNAQTGVQLFGNSGQGSFLTGVAYKDTVTDNDFYTPGEGLNKITIKAVRKGDGAMFTAKSWSSGGYSLKLDPGTYDVTASGTALGTAITYRNVVIATENVKRDFIKSGHADSTVPFATVIASNVITGGATQYTFQVTYNDLNAVKASTIGNGDIKITGGGLAIPAVFVAKSPRTNTHSIVATYRITAPGGIFGAEDNRTYTINLLAGQVTDASGKAAKAAKLGTFSVSIPV